MEKNNEKKYGIERIKTFGNSELIYCNNCFDYLPREEFYNNIRCHRGIDTTCIGCRTDKRNNKHDGKTPLEYHGVKWEVELAKELLMRIGYDLDKNIHEQFNERNKHRLSYNTP